MHGAVVGQADQIGEIVEVRGPSGSPPFIVRFDDGHQGLVFPGPDAVIEPGTPRQGAPDSPPNR